MALSLVAPVIFGILPALIVVAPRSVTERSESASRDTQRAAQHAGRRRGRAVDRARRRRRAAGAQPRRGCRTSTPASTRSTSVAFTMTLPSARYADAAARCRAFEEIERRLREQPGVQAVGADQHAGAARLHLDRRHDDRGPRRHRLRARAAPQVDDARLLQADGHPPAGRADVRRRATRIDKPRVTIVNESLAQQYFRGADASRRQADQVRPAAGQRRLGHRSSASSPTRSRTAWTGRPSRRRIRASASGCRIR